MTIQLPRLHPHSLAFPEVDTALEEPNGLLAFGGDLSVPRLLAAYARGIFPWFGPGEPILWWSPDPRMVFATAEPHVSRRLRRWLRGCHWTFSADTAFREVMQRCAAPRAGQRGTWIRRAMLDAYVELHRLGHAHSIEVRDGAELIGGIYGVRIGRMFFGESMFSARDHASKVALLALCHVLYAAGCPLLDAQVESGHLERMGARTLPRADFICQIKVLCGMPEPESNWLDGLPRLRPVDLAAANAPG